MRRNARPLLFGLAPVLLTLAAALICAAASLASTAGEPRPALAAPPEAPPAIVPAQTVTGTAVAGLAASIVEAITSTRATTVYTHNTFISLTLGIYNTDCSGFVSYLLSRVAPQQLALVPREPGHATPRAFMYYEFFRGLQAGSQAPGWAAVTRLADAQPGDVIAWGLLPIEQYRDTGHVFVVAGSPRLQADGTYLLPVYDSSSVPHYADTRRFPAGGVGTGELRFQVAATGVISAVQFNAPDQYHAVPAAIGRLAGPPAPGGLDAPAPGRAASAATDLAQTAGSIVQNLRETRYTHDTYISPTLGLYNTDCSGFVSYLLSRVAPQQLALVPREPGHATPRAFMYYEFFRGLQAGSQAPGWSAVTRLADAQPGDVIAWGLFPIEQYRDTGHVFVVAGSPRLQADGTYLLPVYDSSTVPHYADTRRYPPGGVGGGELRFQVAATGVISAIQFNAPDQYHAVPATIGRLTGGSTAPQVFLPLTARQNTGW